MKQVEIKFRVMDSEETLIPQIIATLAEQVRDAQRWGWDLRSLSVQGTKGESVGEFTLSERQEW